MTALFTIVILINLVTTIYINRRNQQQLDQMVDIIKRYQQINKEYREMIEMLLPEEELNGD